VAFRSTPIKWALLAASLDAAWAVQAFSSVPRHPGSNVQLVSLIVWVVLHLPAAALASAGLKFFGLLRDTDGAVSPVALGALALAGVAETFGAAYWAVRLLRKKSAAE
jgi:hypothetical protein